MKTEQQKQQKKNIQRQGKTIKSRVKKSIQIKLEEDNKDIQVQQEADLSESYEYPEQQKEKQNHIQDQIVVNEISQLTEEFSAFYKDRKSKLMSETLGILREKYKTLSVLQQGFSIETINSIKMDINLYMAKSFQECNPFKVVENFIRVHACRHFLYQTAVDHSVKPLQFRCGSRNVEMYTTYRKFPILFRDTSLPYLTDAYYYIGDNVSQWISMNEPPADQLQTYGLKFRKQFILLFLCFGFDYTLLMKHMKYAMEIKNHQEMYNVFSHYVAYLHKVMQYRDRNESQNIFQHLESIYWGQPIQFTFNSDQISTSWNIIFKDSFIIGRNREVQWEILDVCQFLRLEQKFMDAYSQEYGVKYLTRYQLTVFDFLAGLMMDQKYQLYIEERRIIDVSAQISFFCRIYSKIANEIKDAENTLKDLEDNKMDIYQFKSKLQDILTSILIIQDNIIETKPDGIMLQVYQQTDFYVDDFEFYSDLLEFYRQQQAKSQNYIFKNKFAFVWLFLLENMNSQYAVKGQSVQWMVQKRDIFAFAFNLLPYYN